MNKEFKEGSALLELGEQEVNRYEKRNKYARKFQRAISAVKERKGSGDWEAF